jgi:cell division protein FtsN
MLAAKGLAGRVFSYAKANDTYFRVRIGPYTNKQEAEKFLSIVQKLQGLEASYISFVPGTRSVN